MAPSDDKPSYLSLYEHSQPLPRQLPGTAASIWAPQPLPSETAWPLAVDSLSLTAEKESQQLSNVDVQPKTSLVSREDVFGPVGFGQKSSPKAIGAIGDGRQKSVPDFGDAVRIFFLFSLAFHSCPDFFSLKAYRATAP